MRILSPGTLTLVLGASAGASFYYKRLTAANDLVKELSRPDLIFLPPLRTPTTWDQFQQTQLLNIGSRSAFRITVHVPDLMGGSVYEIAYLAPQESRVLSGLNEFLSTQFARPGIEMVVTYYSIDNIDYRKRFMWRNAPRTPVSREGAL